jgi:DHA1 family tetracycline resistance protein-like MFS transporter
MAKPVKSAAIGFIFVTLLIDTIGFGVVIPVLPSLIQQLKHCNLSKASQYGGWLLATYSITQFAFAPVLGNLSDRYGRRPVLLFSLLGFGIDYAFQGLAPTLGWLFVGRFIAGITGASFTTASAYIADVSTPENRTQNFGLIGVAFGIGFILGPFLGGELSGFGLRVPFFAAAGLSLLNALFGFFILPESLTRENRRRFEWKRANPVGSLLSLKKYPSLTGLFVSMFFVFTAAHAVQTTWTYFNMEKFHWSRAEVGYSLSFVGLLIGLVQGLLIRPVIPWLGPRKTLYIGLILYTIGCLLFAFASQGWMMYAFLVPYCLGGIAGPSLQSIMAGYVPASEQGELQGLMTSIMSATSVFGPLMMTGLFAYFTRSQGRIYFPGAPFLAGSFFLGCSVVIAYLSLRGKKDPPGGKIPGSGPLPGIPESARETIG